MAVSVLIVEDDRNIAELLQLYLEKEGYAGANMSLGIALLVELAKKAAAAMPDAEIEIGKCWCLTSFYAEKGGMIIGFETKK